MIKTKGRHALKTAATGTALALLLTATGLAGAGLSALTPPAAAQNTAQS